MFYETFAAVMINIRIALCWKWHKRRNDGPGIFHCQEVNYFLDMDPTDGVIVEKDVKMLQFTQLSNKTRTELVRAL